MEQIEIYTDYIDDEGFVLRYNYEKGHYYNTGVCLKGAPGRPGRPGKDGLTPRIGENGNWWIGDIDTLVSAAGGGGSISLKTINGESIEGSGNIAIKCKSAYEIAQDNGYEGSEQLWLTSLQGSDGQDGVTPHIDPISKHWMIGSTDTGIVAEGQNGSNGTNGTNGSDGITPTVNVTTITGGHNVAFSYGSGDPRNTDFNVLDGTTPTGCVTSSTAGLKLEVVSALPANPDTNTIYIVQ